MVQRHKDELDRRAARSRSLPRLVGDGPAGSRARGARLLERRDVAGGASRACGFTRRPAARPLPEDQRRLRPRLRVLRDSAHARQAPLVRARRGRARGAAARAAGRARDQSRRAGSRALRPRSARRHRAARGARGAGRRDDDSVDPDAVSLFGGHHADGCSRCMAREPRILPYLDMPIQHGSDAVLARMRRPERQRTIRERVARVARCRARRRDSHDVHRRLSRRDRRGLRSSCSTSSRRCSSSASARSRTRRRKARAPRRWPTTCPTPSSASGSSASTELQRADHRRAIRARVGRTRARRIVDRVDVRGRGAARGAPALAGRRHRRRHVSSTARLTRAGHVRRRARWTKSWTTTISRAAFVRRRVARRRAPPRAPHARASACIGVDRQLRPVSTAR